MCQEIKDEIARLRTEARHFRDLAKMARVEIARLKAAPMIARCQISILKAGIRVTEYVSAAQERDAQIKVCRSKLGQ